jgi:hypothetical protein
MIQLEKNNLYYEAANCCFEKAKNGFNTLNIAEKYVDPPHLNGWNPG